VLFLFSYSLESTTRLRRARHLHLIQKGGGKIQKSSSQREKRAPNVKAEIPSGFGNADDWVISATLENWDKY
jgi:hypothetical protein